jgi:hypothetical protein
MTGVEIKMQAKMVGKMLNRNRGRDVKGSADLRIWKTRCTIF